MIVTQTWEFEQRNEQAIMSFMTTIDQRILIPAPQTVVWAYISDVSNNPAWQEECKSVAFLTSKREGPGTRWRYGTDKGREYVVEITAWYNGLGYEYIFVDGPGYKNNRGRIRLQEIAEGTIVQWTFSYEMGGGVLSGVRSKRRQIENTMAASLKTLYRKVKQFTAENPIDPKSLMRDAPDVEARSQYRPRHSAPTKPSSDSEKLQPVVVPSDSAYTEPPITEGDGEPIEHIYIDEPPIQQDDTRPRPVVTGFERPPQEVELVRDEAAEPDFLSDSALSEPEVDVFDTQTRAAVTAVEESSYSPPADQASIYDFDFDSELLRDHEVLNVTEEDEPSPAAVLSGQDSFEENIPEDVVAVSAEHKPEEIPQIFEAEPDVSIESPVIDEAPVLPVATEAVVAEKPTASIWEIFGVPRPTADYQSAVDTPAAEPDPSPETKPRQGYRIRLRRKLVRLHRPIN